MAPRTRYASCGDTDIAYQVFGDGPMDLVVLPGPSIPIDTIDAEPSMYRFHRRLASFARVIRLDQRGIGLSSRAPSVDVIGPKFWAKDVIAVMNAVECEQATILAPGFTGATGLVLAADYPERVSSLVIINGAARALYAPDYPIGADIDTLDPDATLLVDPDAVEQGFDMLGIIAPSVARDDAFRAWWDMAGNRAASPSMALAMIKTIRQADVRDTLPRITAPTLILHRADSDFTPVAHGRYLAEHIAGSRIVELPGEDSLYWVGHTGPMLDEIEEFITGMRGGSDAERLLTTIVFTDIVGSTERAALLGDDRWRDLLDNHDTVVRHELQRFGGREVNTPPATGSSRRSAVRAPRSRAPTKSSTRCMCWASKCGSAFTRARSRCVGTTSPAWPCTSARASRRRPGPARCWCPRRCATSSPARGIGSPTAVNANSRACRASGDSAPWSGSMCRSGQ